MNESEFPRVLHDNIRDHQIGGRTDGMSEETARDLGFSTPETLQQDIDNAPRLADAMRRVGEYVRPEHREWRHNLPTDEQKAIGRKAIEEIRKQFPPKD